MYLETFGSISAYVEVFKYKQFMFPFTFEKMSQNILPGFYAAERTFTEFMRGLSILIGLAAISFYFVNKSKKMIFMQNHGSQLIMRPTTIVNSEKTSKYSALLYAIGSFLGFGLGGSYGSHYLIQTVVPFYIMGGLIVSYLFSNVSYSFIKSKSVFWLLLILFMCSVVVITPKRQYLSSYLPRSVNFVTTDQTYGFEKRIGELTTKDQCILSVYGWGVSENYLYSMRRPCTRFFLPNIVIQDWQKKEYARDIMENPPALIVYRTIDSDMDINKFESEVIDINMIVKNCYIQDKVEKIIFVPKVDDVLQLKNCVMSSAL